MTLVPIDYCGPDGEPLGRVWINPDQIVIVTETLFTVDPEVDPPGRSAGGTVVRLMDGGAVLVDTSPPELVAAIREQVASPRCSRCGCVPPRHAEKCPELSSCPSCGGEGYVTVADNDEAGGSHREACQACQW